MNDIMRRIAYQMRKDLHKKFPILRDLLRTTPDEEIFISFLECSNCHGWLRSPKEIIRELNNGTITTKSELVQFIYSKKHTCMDTDDVVDFDHLIHAEEYASEAHASSLITSLLDNK